MSTLQTFRQYREAFMRLLYPARCGACETLLELEETGICTACTESLEKLRFPYSATALDHEFEHVSQAWALYPYESVLKEILTGIKFYNKRWLLRIFTPKIEELAGLIASENNYDWIVPIPLENSRLLERQFNQSELIARILAKAMQRPVISALKKCRRTPAQSGLNRAERLRNLHFAFEAKIPAAGKKILIVDDVLTTGATAEEAARVLKDSGACRADLVTIACNPRETSADSTFSPLYIPANFVGY